MASEVQIIVSAKDLATQTIKSVSQGLINASKATDQFASSVARMSIKASVALIGVRTSAKKLLEIGSDAVELENVVVETFGNMAREINAWADDIAAPMNRSNYQMREFAGMMGAMVVPIMRNKQLATEMSKDLAELAVDMASFWNVMDEETFNAIRSGLIGQIRPLQRFGISMTVASLQAFALEKGIKKSVQAMTESEKMHLRYQYLLEYTAIQQGDAARNADTYANILKGLGADVRNTTEDFGLLMQPLGIELIRNLRDGVKWLGNLDDEVKMTIIRWGTFGTALLGGITVFGLVTKAAASFVNGLMLVGTAISLLTSPLVIKFALISTGIALVAHVWDQNLAGIQDKTKVVVDKVRMYWGEFLDWWQGVPAMTPEGITSGYDKDIPGFKHKLLDIKDFFGSGWKWTIDIGTEIYDWIFNTTWADKWTNIKGLFKTAWDWTLKMIGWEWVKTELPGFVTIVEGLKEKLGEAWEWTLKTIIDTGGALYDAIKTGLDTGNWGAFWSVANDTWSKGVLLGVGLSPVISGISLAKGAIISGLSLAGATAKATGMAGMLGLITIGLQFMEAHTNDTMTAFAHNMIAALIAGLLVGGITASPKAGALAFTITANLKIGEGAYDGFQVLFDWISYNFKQLTSFKWDELMSLGSFTEMRAADTFEKAYYQERKDTVLDLLKGFSGEQLLYQLELQAGIWDVEENDLRKTLGLPLIEEKILQVPVIPKAMPMPDTHDYYMELQDNWDNLWKKDTPVLEIEIEPIPVGMEKFSRYLLDVLSEFKLPSTLDPLWIIGQLGAEVGWGKDIKAPFNLGNIKGLGPAGNEFYKDMLEYDKSGMPYFEESYFAAYNNIREFMAAYLGLLETTFPLAYAAKDIEQFISGLQNGKYGAYATDPYYDVLMRDVNWSLQAKGIKGYSDGVILPGYGGGDRRLALLEDGEAVVPKEAVRGGRNAVVEWLKKMGVPGFQKGKVPSIPGIGSSTITDAEDTISGMQTIFANLGNSVISGFVTVFDVVFDVVENLAVKILGEEAVDSIKVTVEKGKERLQGLIDTLYPQPKKPDEDDSEEEEEVTLSKWQEWHQNFVAVNKAQMDYVTNMSKLLQNFNANAAKSISNVQNFLDIVANFPIMLETVQGGFIGLQEQIAAIFGGGSVGAFAGRIGAGLASWNAFSQGSTQDSTNWIGGIAGSLAGLGIGGPWTAGIALGSQIIGSIFPGTENEDKATDEQLQKRIEGYNKTLKEWGASFQSDNLSFKADGGFLGWRHLFGNVKWETIGKDLAEKGSELAEKLIRSMQSIFDTAGQGLFDVIFAGADFSDFSKVIGKQMQQTLMAEILNMAVIKEPLQRLSAYIAEAVEGGFSANELATIKDMMGDVYSAAQPFGDMAKELADQFGLAEESARGLTSTMRNAPSGYKVDLTRWYATQGVKPSGSSGVTPRQWESNTATRPVQLNFNAPIYGVNDLKSTIQDALDEYDRRTASDELAYSGVMA